MRARDGVSRRDGDRDVGACAPPHAVAQDEEAINGTFTAFSDGQWARPTTRTTTN